MALPVLVINRDQDTDRLTAFRTSADAHGTDFERIPAIDAHAPGFSWQSHAQMIGTHFWGRTDIKPGAIGCYLSHMRAWQHLLDTDLPRALICEDDAMFLRDPAGIAGVVENLGPLDLLFVNRRLGSWAAATSREPSAALHDVIAGLAAQGGPKANGLKAAPGGDCYLLNQRGAARLLDMAQQQRVICGVDWAMVWNSLLGVSAGVGAAFPELGILAQHLPAPSSPLISRVLTTPVADQSGKGGSTIRHAITVPISELLRSGGV